MSLSTCLRGQVLRIGLDGFVERSVVDRWSVQQQAGCSQTKQEEEVLGREVFIYFYGVTAAVRL